MSLSRYESEELVEVRNKQLEKYFSNIQNFLKNNIKDEININFYNFKKDSQYPVEQPKLNKFAPIKPGEPVYPIEPKKSDNQYRILRTLLDYIFNSIYQKKLKEMTEKFNQDHYYWESSVNKLKNNYEESVKFYYQEQEKYNEFQKKHILDLEKWNIDKDNYEKEVDLFNSELLIKRKQYNDGNVDGLVFAINLYFGKYDFPVTTTNYYEIEYLSKDKTLLIDFQLPIPSQINNTKSLKYIISKDKIEESKHTDKFINSLYEDYIYQVCLKVVNDTFLIDKGSNIESVIFNGHVLFVNPSNGNEEVACILSIKVNRNEFSSIDLKRVEPKACFKSLKGVSASKLYSLSSIPPLLKLNKNDSRFVSSYDVVGNIDDATNLAMMDWEDFEHLIRELFEKEFSSQGGEVKVTQASRDGGVDAIAFDPDPVRGGKFVIQAKRYTNTVGVSAVRDLYGTVIVEGANKGILVTTSDYGPDSYQFASGKPLVLLNGGNLLYLLEKHGHKAKIDINEAKRMQKLNESR